MVDYNVKLIADSVNPCGDRLTTFELTYPRVIHAQVLTHRMWSRNSASSRAIPTKKLRERVRNHPVVPKFWGKNQKGMQATEELTVAEIHAAQDTWFAARDAALGYAADLYDLGVHKQLVNRLIEPWMFITVIVTATEYENFFALRDTEEAQPEIAWVAREMRKLYEENEPTFLREGEWHLPYVETQNRESHLYVDPLNEQLLQIATARCARVSYLTHDGKRNIEEDVRLHDRLVKSGHLSPFEHPACALGQSKRVGNFMGWKQYRKLFPNEHRGRQIETIPPSSVGEGYTPLYAQMEAAFREELLIHAKTCDIAMQKLERFFPRDAVKLMKERRDEVLEV